MKIDNIKLLHDFILIKREDADLKTKGGIVIPNDLVLEKAQGKVLACGPGRRNKKGKLKAISVKVGDVIIFQRHAFLDFDYKGQACIMIREDKVLGVME